MEDENHEEPRNPRVVVSVAMGVLQIDGARASLRDGVGEAVVEVRSQELISPEPPDPVLLPVPMSEPVYSEEREGASLSRLLDVTETPLPPFDWIADTPAYPTQLDSYPPASMEVVEDGSSVEDPVVVIEEEVEEEAAATGPHIGEIMDNNPDEEVEVEETHGDDLVTAKSELSKILAAVKVRRSTSPPKNPLGPLHAPPSASRNKPQPAKTVEEGDEEEQSAARSSSSSSSSHTSSHTAGSEGNNVLLGFCCIILILVVVFTSLAVSGNLS